MSAHPTVLIVEGDVEMIVDEVSTIPPDGKEHNDGPSKPSNTPRRHIRIRRGPRYQIQNLIREKSPKPDQQVMKNVAGQHDNIDKPDEKESTVASKEPSTESENRPSEHPDGFSPLSSSKKTVQCNICQRLMTESRLANHIRLLHLTKEGKDFRCDYCGKTYAVKYTFEQHVKTHTEGRPKCPECGSTFASPFSLFRHRAKAHNLEHNYTTHSCDKCDKIFFSSSELTCHKQRHSNEKVHICLECNKSFAARGNLRIHMRTHAKEKPYKCDMCDNSFSHPYSLVSHRRIHTNDFPFSCEECGKNYRSKHQLTSHKTVHSDERPYGCDQCTKTFRSRTAFRMHQDQHKGIKRFVCQFCDRKFQCNANKTKHERRHIGVKRFKCDTCDKAFIERQELKNHERVHAKQNTSSKTSKDNQDKTEDPTPRPDSNAVPNAKKQS